MLSIEYSDYAANQIDGIFSNNGIYNRYGCFSQKFLNWNGEFHHYVSAKMISRTQLTQHGWYRIGTIGLIEYKHITLNDTGVFEILAFHFFRLPYPTPRCRYILTGDAGFGYKIIKSTFNGLYSILTPQQTQLTKFTFDNIIGFHHSSEDYNEILAIGFIGNRVYSITEDGNVVLLRMSKKGYLETKHRYDENRRHRLFMINELNNKKKLYTNMKQRIRLTEGQLHNIIRKCVNEAVNEIGDTHPGGRIGFAQDAANLALQKGRTKQADNILQSFEDSYNSYRNGRERNTPRVRMYFDNDSEMRDDYADDLDYKRYSEPGQININGDDSDLETFRKPYQLLPARQRNNANKRVDDFKKYRDYMRSKGNV